MANDDWISPLPLVTASRKFLGRFELDPASSPMAQKIIKAKTWCSPQHKIKKWRDGLAINWRPYKTMWLNSPYSQPLMTQYIDKSMAEMQCGLVLTNASLDTGWAHSLLNEAITVLFTRGRLEFLTNKLELPAPGTKLSGVDVEKEDGQVTITFEVKHKKVTKRLRDKALKTTSDIKITCDNDTITVNLPCLVPVNGNRVGQALWYIRNHDSIKRADDFSTSIDMFHKIFEPFGTTVELGKLP